MTEPRTKTKHPGLCECGCGEKTTIYKGQPRRFIMGHNFRSRTPGDIYHDANGYVRIFLPDHPRAQSGYVYEHRHVAEQKLGRLLERGEVVHHINGVTSDNRSENLEVFANQAEHRRHHIGEACKRGHKFTPENTATRWSRGRPFRQCRECERAKNRRMGMQRRRRLGVTPRSY